MQKAAQKPPLHHIYNLHVSIIPLVSKHLVRRYLDPPNIPKTPNLRRYDWKTRDNEAVHYAPHGYLDVKNIACDFPSMFSLQILWTSFRFGGTLVGDGWDFWSGILKSPFKVFSIFRYLKWRNPKKLVCLRPRWWFQRFGEGRSQLAAELFEYGFQAA